MKMSQEEMKKFAEPQDIVQDVHELSLQTRVAHADEREDEERGGEAGEEEEEEEEEEDFYDDDLMWFDGHQVTVGQVRRACFSSLAQGVSGNFTKTFKAEVAGNRPNTAASQHAVIMVGLEVTEVGS